MSEIQIQFPVPGQWQMFSMTAVFQDDAGYSRSDRYKSGEIPAEQLIALQAVIEALVGLKEEWQAVQEAGEEYLAVTPTSLSVPAEGGTFSVQVVYNTSETPYVDVDIPWATRGGSQVMNNGSSWERPRVMHHFTAEANDTGEVRSGIITVTLNGQSQTCVVTQEVE